MTDGEKGVHSIGRLVDLSHSSEVSQGIEETETRIDIKAHLIVLRSSLEVLESKHKEEDMGEGSDGVGVSAEHQVRESDVVVDGDVSSSDAREQRLLVELDTIEHSESESVVTKQDVDSKESQNGEVS